MSITKTWEDTDATVLENTKTEILLQNILIKEQNKLIGINNEYLFQITEDKVEEVDIEII